MAPGLRGRASPSKGRIRFCFLASSALHMSLPWLLSPSSCASLSPLPHLLLLTGQGVCVLWEGGVWGGAGAHSWEETLPGIWRKHWDPVTSSSLGLSPVVVHRPSPALQASTDLLSLISVHFSSPYLMLQGGEHFVPSLGFFMPLGLWPVTTLPTASDWLTCYSSFMLV